MLQYKARMKTCLIIQGPYYDTESIQTIKTIKLATESKLFSKICLSTYDHPKLRNLEKYKIDIIKNIDPGCKSWDKYRKCFNNHNRQIHTLKEAIQSNEFDFTLKIRSDCIIYDFKKFKNILDAFMESNKDYFFCDTTSVDYKVKYQKILYHLSDWVLGFKKNVSNNVKEIPYDDEINNTQWVENLTGNMKDLYKLERCSTKFGGEQWITLNLLRRGEFPITHGLEYSEQAEKLYEEDLEKVMCVPLYKIGIKSMKYKTIHFPHYDRFENYLGVFEKSIYKILGYTYKHLTNVYVRYLKFK